MIGRTKARLWRPRILLPLLVGVVAGIAIGRFLLNSSAARPGQVIGVVVTERRTWVQKEHLPSAAVPGAKVFESAGCPACHTYAGAGGSNLGAPDLTAIGSRHLGIDFQIAHLRCPACINPGSPMPPFAALGHTRLHELAVFLEDSHGIR